MSKITDIVRKICKESGIECNEDEMVPEGIRFLAPNANLAEVAQSLTIDDLIRMMPEIEAKFPKEKMPPNPADVHPATFAALVNVCTPGEVRETSILGGVPFDEIELHVCYDAEPWKLNQCTCGKGRHDRQTD